jgi:hypothetical protein
MSLGRLGGVTVLLYGGHELADLWLQTNDQANDKGEPGRKGQWACAKHVVTLTATQAAFLAVGCITTGERLNPRRVALGLAFNAVTHYAADRREHGLLPKLANRLSWMGKDKFLALGDGKAAPCGTAAYGLDKAFHIAVLPIAAAIITGGTDTR